MFIFISLKNIYPWLSKLELGYTLNSNLPKTINISVGCINRDIVYRFSGHFSLVKCKETVIIDVIVNFIKKRKKKTLDLMVIGMICLGTETREKF